MAFQNDTNTGRVQKMIDLLAHLKKSAGVNGASDAELAEMLKPLTGELAVFTDATSDQPSEDRQFPELAQLKPGQRAALILADQASLRELIAALMGRLDAHADRLEGQP
ncbi:hypothetical protein [Roseobacter weihaiensis]|uniref:hypothetical protein n=1 Tax=Roseobacter weihaiensis TaxID=2763262 RepID=UPI001D0B530C|nr:hypothetical protein [Roseobacter sp. H9]